MPDPADSVDDYLDAQRDVLTRDVRDLYNGAMVHKTRIAARRYRSVLRVFAELFDPVEAGHLDTELRWYAGVLGDVRDLQVLRARLPDLLDELSRDLGFDTTTLSRRMNDELDSRERRAQRALQRALVSQRFEALLSAVVATAPGADGTHGLEHYFDSAQRSARTRLRRAKRLESHDPTKDDQLHRARKAVKRARYAAELAAPVVGRRAERMIDRWRRVQDELGVHQDAVFATAFLQSVASDPDDLALGALWERSRRL